MQLTEIQWYILHSYPAQSSRKLYNQLLIDWGIIHPIEQIQKFIPGEHYHALGCRFDSFHAAKAHLEKYGYTYGGLKIHRIFADSD